MLSHVPNLSMEEYNKAEGVRSSGITKILKETPAHYRAYVTSGSTETKAMAFGSAAHAAILEPETFLDKFVCKPEGMSFATTEGKAWKAANANKDIISFDEFQAIRGWQKTIMASPALRKYLSGGKAEQSYFWTDAETGLVCKCRPDYFDGSTVVDIKTAESASFSAFQKSIAQYSYHVQSAFYLEGLSAVAGAPITDFVHIVLEKNAPYDIAIYMLDDASIDRAREDVRRGLEIIKTCTLENQWPGYPKQAQPMNLPAWMWGNE